jgi:RHS repeat-associated protein
MAGKLTDLGFKYSARGEISDTYQWSPHSGAGNYVHFNATYWQNGLLDAFSSNLSGLPTLTTTPDGEGRIYSMAASSGQSPVSAVAYDGSSNATRVNYGSNGGADHDTFSFDPNTERPTGYAINVNSLSYNATITNNTNGTVGGLNITDGFFSGDTQTCAYVYDDLNRLLTNNCGSVWGASYTYDSFGNISKGTYGSDPGTSFLPTFNLSTNRFATIPSGTLSYDADGNLTSDGTYTYGWDAEGNLITVSGVTGTFDALGRRLEVDNSGTYEQMMYPPFAPTYQMALAEGLTAEGIRMPLPGGGEAIFNSTGLSNYRHPNWQRSQVVLSWPSGSPNPNVGGAFTPFGEKYAIYPGGFNGFFAGMLGIADEGPIQYAYQATARLMQQEAGRWVSPDPAGLGAVDFSNPQSWNRYSYALNNPLNFMDPSGLCTEEVNGDYYSNGDSECPATPAPAPLDIGYTIYATAYDFYDSSITGLWLFLDTFASLGGFPGLGFSPALGATGSAGPGSCSANVSSFVTSNLPAAQTLAASLKNGVTPAEVLAVAGNETGFGGGFAKYGNYFGLHGSGPSGTYYTTQNHTPVAMFPVINGFLLSGQAFVNNVSPFMTPGLGANPLAFFTVLNKHGYATGNSGYPAYMVRTGKSRGPYTQVIACMGGHS